MSRYFAVLDEIARNYTRKKLKRERMLTVRMTAPT